MPDNSKSKKMKKILHFMLFVFVIGTANAQTPIYQFDFDGNTNSSGTGTFNGFTTSGAGVATYVNNRAGQANKAISIPNNLTFVNSGSVNAPNLPDGNSSRTLSFWVKFINDDDNKTYCPVGWGSSIANQAFGFWRNGFQNSYYTWGSGNDYNVPQSNAQIQATNNGWVHIAMTHNGTTLTIYYNGVDAGNYPRTLNTFGPSYLVLNRLVNGASNGTGDALQLDDLKIYNTALTAAQITSLYNNNTTGTTPAMPTITNVSATNIGNTTVTINYTVNANNASTTTEVRYGVSPGGSPQTQTGPSATGSSNTPLSVNLTGLSPNTTYEYNVWVFNSQGTAFLASSLFFTTAGSTAPPAITAINANAITNNAATINFSINTFGIASPTTINYGTSATVLNSSVQGPIVTSSAATPTSINLTGLSANTTYYYQVVATNTNGITSSNINNFTTLATPPAPTPIYHYKFSGNLNEENGGPALTLSPLTNLPFSFPNNSELLLPKDNLDRTPFFKATLPNLPQGNSARTVSIRINYESGALANSNNVFSWGTTVNDQAYGFSQGTSNINNSNNYFWGSNDLTFPMATSFATWYTLTFVYNGSFVSIYRDGSLFQQVARNLNTNGNVLRIGATPNENVRFLHARIDDLQIYNTALTATQIAALNTQLLSANDFNSSNLNFSLYPNPTNSIVNINLETELKSVEIYSLQGQKVVSSQEKNVNVSALSSGVYFVRVEDVDGLSNTKKLIIK